MTMKELLSKFKTQLKNVPFKKMFSDIIKKRVKAIEEDGQMYLKLKDDSF